MSYSRQREAIDDCFEMNHRIVARQRAAIDALEDLTDLTREQRTINILEDIISMLKGQS